MELADFGRYGCRLGKRRLSYDTLEREYVCQLCGGRFKLFYEEAWVPRCARCGKQYAVHEYAYRSQHSVEARERMKELVPDELKKYYARKQDKWTAPLPPEEEE